MATINVPGDYASIQTALSAGAVSDGDTIQLGLGYSVDEKITPTGLNSVTILGDVENPDLYDVYYSNPDGVGGDKTIAMNNCTNMSMKGFKLRYTGPFSSSSGAGHGGYLDNGGHLFEDMIVETSGYYGLSGMGSNTTYRRVRFDGSYHTAANSAYLLGPDSSGASGTLVESCLVVNASYICIYLGTGGNPGPTIKNTTVYNNRTDGSSSPMGMYILGDNAKVYNTVVGMDCSVTGDKALLFGTPGTATASNCVLYGSHWGDNSDLNSTTGTVSEVVKGSGVSSSAVVFRNASGGDFLPFIGDGALLLAEGMTADMPLLDVVRRSYKSPHSIGAFASYSPPYMNWDEADLFENRVSPKSVSGKRFTIGVCWFDGSNDVHNPIKIADYAVDFTRKSRR